MSKKNDEKGDGKPKSGNKIEDPFTPVHNEVFENLVAKWPLSLPALRFTGYVARWSWGWKGSHWTRDPLHLPTVAGFTRMHRATAWKAQKELLEAGIIEIRADGRAKINKYKLAECCQLATAKYQAKQKSKAVAISQPLPTGNQSVASSQPNKGKSLPSRNQDSSDKQETQAVTSAERQFKESKERKRGAHITRAHAPLVQYFVDGFQKKYQEPYVVKKGHVIALNNLRRQPGITDDSIQRKMDAWWDADLNVKGQRDLGAFIAWFNSIPTVRVEEEMQGSASYPLASEIVNAKDKNELVAAGA